MTARFLVDPQARNYAKPDDLVDSAIKENVHQSARDLMANGEIVRNAIKSGKLTVIEAEYKFDTGKLVRLDSPAGNQN